MDILKEVTKMTILKELGIVLLIGLVGHVLSTELSLFIPGNVLGMLILFVLLYFKVIKLHSVEKITDMLLYYLPFLFIPAGVGIIKNMDYIKDIYLQLTAVIVISTLVTMVATGVTVQLVKGAMKHE